MWALLVRDVRLGVRAGGGALTGVLFFLAVVSSIPFAVGPDINLLARLGPAVLWIGALLAGLLGLDRLFQGIIRYHKENFIAEERLHDIVMVAVEENWQSILSHKQTLRNAIELILRDGIDSGELDPVDPRETAGMLMRAMIGFCHPVLLARAIADGEEPEREGTAQLKFLLKAILRRS